jgi:hypothetical protein
MSKNSSRTVLTAIALVFAAQSATAAPIISMESDVEAIRVVVVDTSSAAMDVDVNVQIDGRLLDPDHDDIVIQHFGDNGIAFDISNVEAGSRLVQVAAVSPTSTTTRVEFLTVDSSTSKSKGLNYAKIWRTATRMARQGIYSGVIKVFLERKGYICPSFLPWMFCARPAGG